MAFLDHVKPKIFFHDHYGGRHRAPLLFKISGLAPGLSNIFTNFRFEWLHITVSDAARYHCLYSRCDAKQSSLSVHHYSEPLFLRTILGGCFWSLINADSFYVCNRPWFSDEYPWRLHYIPSLGSLGLFNFYLN